MSTCTAFIIFWFRVRLFGGASSGSGSNSGTKQQAAHASSGSHVQSSGGSHGASAEAEEDSTRAKPKQKQKALSRSRGLPTIDNALIGTKARPDLVAGTGTQDEEDDRAGRHRLLDKYKKAAV